MSAKTIHYLIKLASFAVISSAVFGTILIGLSKTTMWEGYTSAGITFAFAYMLLDLIQGKLIVK